MFGYKNYVPILKGKRAEFSALAGLGSKDGLTPLMEGVPTAPVQAIPDGMSAGWAIKAPFFVDFLFFPDDPVPFRKASVHPLSACFGYMPAGKLNGIPVTGTGRSPEYQDAVRKIVHERKQGYAIRLSPVDFEDEGHLIAAIDALLGLLGGPKSSVDIIIDQGTVAALKGATVAGIHRSNLSLLPYVKQWRTVTVAAGAFPPSLYPLTRSAWNVASRSDWLGWESLVGRGKKPERLPAYGDYATASPELPPVGRATILAQLRYSTPDTFLIWKGHNVFTHRDGFSQFFSICADLVARPEFKGPGFSAGDALIQEKSAKRGGPGNAELWRRIATNHHLETVKDQVASLP